jgi:hypothetical protein
MTIPPELQALINRLNQELDETEEKALSGINLVRPVMAEFSDNVILIQFFASFSNTLLFVEISRRRVEITINRLSSTDITPETLLEAGEDLSTELGKVLEARIQIERLLNRLQELS